MSVYRNKLIGAVLGVLVCIPLGKQAARADGSRRVPARLVPYSDNDSNVSIEPVRWGNRDRGYYGGYYGAPRAYNGPRSYYGYDYGYRPYRSYYGPSYGRVYYYGRPYGTARVGPERIYW